MRFILLLALFCVMFVEGNLRGDHGHDDDESRTLKKCKPGRNKCQTPGGSSGGGPNVDPTTGGLLREPGELREGECDSSKFPVIQDAHDITFCRSNNDCDGYKPRKAALGTVCCLRDRCFCGTTADAGGCYADPQFRLGEPGSSFMITVPTVPPPPIQENP